MAHSDRLVTVAIITGAHGVTGEVRLKLLGEGVAPLKDYSSFNGGALSLSAVRDNKGGAIARFKEIADRNTAERFRGTELTVSREALPDLPEGEYYHCDLIGLVVISSGGEEVGRVVAVDNYGAGDVLEIEKPDGKTFMVPMNEHAVPDWNDVNLTVSADFVE